ncbi:unnamed protein product [Linum trigynum]|uniref:Uncharacterized protein n=1 Tax=Linum trigynum TaxID=586398 RepID=A0AAV2EP05_9ROSI
MGTGTAAERCSAPEAAVEDLQALAQNTAAGHEEVRGQVAEILETLKSLVAKVDALTPQMVGEKQLDGQFQSVTVIDRKRSDDNMTRVDANETKAEEDTAISVNKTDCGREVLESFKLTPLIRKRKSYRFLAGAGRARAGPCDANKKPHVGSSFEEKKQVAGASHEH